MELLAAGCRAVSCFTGIKGAWGILSARHKLQALCLSVLSDFVEELCWPPVGIALCSSFRSTWVLRKICTLTQIPLCRKGMELRSTQDFPAHEVREVKRERGAEVAGKTGERDDEAKLEKKVLVSLEGC